MLYKIVVQNLELQVKLPDGSDTLMLDRVVKEFNDHLVTFNNGKSVDLFPSKEIKLLILTMISFILGMVEKQNQERPAEASAVATPSEPVSREIEEAALEATLTRLIALCDSGLKTSL